MASKHERKMGIREASSYTGLSTGTLSYAAKCDPPRLRSFKVSEFGPYLFTASDLDAFLAGMATIPAPTEPAPKQKRRVRARAR